ncbi:hypothetical protein [Paraliomyxa miuraensis]|uniref:hypothetical protein n=1 Tax=Paraliomyxa miuraensis TaxID=376150 RepID=UPI00224D61A7|nr:hypothetical protein [Paraliomyxa miuraensis]MCX4246311.1 hypothetical protein [Paraliomyxa miuraensis]
MTLSHRHPRRSWTRSTARAGRIAQAACPGTRVTLAALLGLLGLAGLAACSVGADTNARGPGLGFGGQDDEDDLDADATPTEEQTFTLRLDDATPPPLSLEMDRAEVVELFGDRAADITLLQLDPTPMLADALLAVRDSCGTAWQQDSDDPGHDCSLTPLGQTYKGSDGTWRSSSEYAMVRLLTMTPANVVVEGTTSEGLAELADSMPLLIGSYGTVLSDALGVPRTQTVVSNDALVTAFREYFVKTHPAALPDGTLPITLEDALSDMATLSARLGPAGAHPGIVDPSAPMHGEVFGPGFKMVAVAESNLRLRDGVDVDGVGKTYATTLEGPDGAALHFDFADPAAFRVEGLVEELQIDLRIRVHEHDDFVGSCVGAQACKTNLPGAPLHNGTVWAMEPWTTEVLIAAAAYEDYEDRVFSQTYAIGTASIEIGHNGNPPGWLEYDVFLDMGNPPKDQFLWETVLEVAQVALHHTPYTSLPEGGADVAFTLQGVDVGLTGTEAADAVRPFLQQQSTEISDYLLGNVYDDNVGIDFYYRRGEDGVPYVFFVAPSDLPQGTAYAHPIPGFFDDPGLAEDTKVSERELIGVADTEHEKLAITEGQTVVYFADEHGQRYRARFVHRGDDRELEVAVGAL